jgi:hypothetical protein
MNMQVVNGGKGAQSSEQGVRNLYAWVMNAGDSRGYDGENFYDLEVIEELSDVNRPLYVYAHSVEEAKDLARKFILQGWDVENPFRMAPIEILGVVTDFRALTRDEVGILYGSDIGDAFEVTLVQKKRVGLLQILNDPFTGEFLD